MPEIQQDNESTKIVLMKMAKSRRKGIAAAAVALVVGGALVAVWAATSAKSCLADRAELEAAFEPPAKGGHPPGVMDPGSITASVYIFLSTEGSIAIDGFPTVKGATRLKTELKPGDHTIRAELKKNTFEQSLVAKAGEGFLIDFDDDGRSVSIKRLYNVK